MKLHKTDEGRLATEPRCPICDSILDGFTVVGDERVVPKDGDISICAYCATPLMVAGEQWAKLEGDDLAEAWKNPSFRLAMFMVRAVRRERQS